MDSCICLTRRVLQISSYKVWPNASLRSKTGCLRIDSNWTRTKRNSAGSGQDNSWLKQTHIPSTLDHRQYNLGVIIDEQFRVKEHVRRICCSAYHQLRQLRVVRKSLSTEACEALVHAFVSSRLDNCNCLLRNSWETVEKQLRNSWTSYNPCYVRPLVSYFANEISIRSRLICETSFTGFPFNNESNTRSACLFSSADETRRQLTSPRCCILWSLSRDTNCVSSPRKWTTSKFPGHDLFVRSGPRCFSVSGPTLWNSLPFTVK